MGSHSSSFAPVAAVSTLECHTTAEKAFTEYILHIYKFARISGVWESGFSEYSFCLLRIMLVLLYMGRQKRSKAGREEIGSTNNCYGCSYCNPLGWG